MLRLSFLSLFLLSLISCSGGGLALAPSATGNSPTTLTNPLSTTQPLQTSNPLPTSTPTASPTPNIFTTTASPTPTASPSLKATTSPSPTPLNTSYPLPTTSPTITPSPSPSPTSSTTGIPVTIPIPSAQPKATNKPVFGTAFYPGNGGSGECTTNITFTMANAVADVSITELNYFGTYSVSKNTQSSVASAKIISNILQITSLASGTTVITVSDINANTSDCTVTL